LPAVLKEAKLSPDETWVMGGAEIYALFMPYCREAHVTRISACDPEADCWMANLDAAIGWERIEKGILQEWGGLHFRYDRYRNRGTIGLPIG
jgi:dihydrofolate reductase